MSFEFYLSYNIGDNLMNKTFTDMSELKEFLVKLCEIKQTNTIYLNSCEFKVKDKREKKE